MDKKRRLSVQREKIYKLVKENNNHPTALWIYEKLKKEFPTMSLGNLYRNIRILIEENRVRSRVFRDGVEHFDAVLKLHHHFICENCSEITDIFLPMEESLTEIIQTKIRHKVNSHTIQFYGVCSECKKR